MKKILPFATAAAMAFFALDAKAQLPDGSIAPDFTFTDMNGNTQNLYSYLNAGKSVVIDISATWCGPCWSYHTSNALKNFYNQYGPPGTNQAMVIWIEGDGNTNNACMTNSGGCTGGTQGNWVSGTPYPMCNPASGSALSSFLSGYQIQYYPTMYLICAADKKTKKVDQYTTSQLAAALNACPPPAPSAANDAGIPTIVSPNGTACGSTITPVVTVRNYGSATLTSCVINYKVDNNPVQTFNWNGNLATNATQNVTLPNVTTTSGPHTFTAYTSNPNNATDGNTANDQKTSNFSASATAMNIPIMEGMENATFPPTGWKVVNSDAGITWARTTVAKKTGSASMFMDNYDYNSNGQVDEFNSDPIDLSNVINPSLTFEVAYQMYSNPSTYASSDSLKVYASSDCGVTWTKVYDKAHTALITATPQYSTTEFVPNSSQWRQETVSLNNFAGSNSVLVKFVHTTDYENNLYVDDINITGTVSVHDIDLSSYVSVYPNPSTGYVFVNMGLLNQKNLNVKVRNMVGEVIAESVGSEKMIFDLNGQSSGMYFIEVKSAEGTAIKKVMLNK